MQTPCPEEHASIISKITYSWLDKYIYQWFKQEMTDESVFELRRDDESKKNVNAVEKLFLKKINAHRKTKK